jgi:predicted nucleic acid-binding protein
MVELYVADAHAFVRYLTNTLPEKIDRIFEMAEQEKTHILIPAIAVAEIIYIFEKTESEHKLWEMFNKIDLYPSFSIHPLDERILKIIPEISLKELHDRIIVATCILVKAKGLITKDENIRKSELVKTIW